MGQERVILNPQCQSGYFQYRDGSILVQECQKTPDSKPLVYALSTEDPACLAKKDPTSCLKPHPLYRSDEARSWLQNLAFFAPKDVQEGLAFYVPLSDSGQLAFLEKGLENFQPPDYLAYAPTVGALLAGLLGSPEAFVGLLRYAFPGDFSLQPFKLEIPLEQVGEIKSIAVPVLNPAELQRRLKERIQEMVDRGFDLSVVENALAGLSVEELQRLLGLSDLELVKTICNRFEPFIRPDLLPLWQAVRDVFFIKPSPKKGDDFDTSYELFLEFTLASTTPIQAQRLAVALSRLVHRQLLFFASTKARSGELSFETELRNKSIAAMRIFFSYMATLFQKPISDLLRDQLLFSWLFKQFFLNSRMFTNRNWFALFQEIDSPIFRLAILAMDKFQATYYYLSIASFETWGNPHPLERSDIERGQWFILITLWNFRFEFPRSRGGSASSLRNLFEREFTTDFSSFPNIWRIINEFDFYLQWGELPQPGTPVPLPDSPDRPFLYRGFGLPFIQLLAEENNFVHPETFSPKLGEEDEEEQGEFVGFEQVCEAICLSTYIMQSDQVASSMTSLQVSQACASMCLSGFVYYNPEQAASVGQQFGKRLLRTKPLIPAPFVY